CAFY
ncbi:hypothetical protein D029_4771B, partial [Vibrio parahaemolyticus 970107]